MQCSEHVLKIAAAELPASHAHARLLMQCFYCVLVVSYHRESQAEGAKAAGRKPTGNCRDTHKHVYGYQRQLQHLCSIKPLAERHKYYAQL